MRGNNRTSSITSRDRAEFWLSLIADLAAERTPGLPDDVVAGALTMTFDATATAVHTRVGGEVTQTVHSNQSTGSDRWDEANRFARTRAATDHPLLAYYLATGDARAHDVDSVPLLVEPNRVASWRDLAAQQGVHRQIAIPIVHTDGQHTSFVIGRSDRFSENELIFARRLQQVLWRLNSPARDLVAPADPHGVGLTPRELASLSAVAEGLTADAAARKLGISPRTVHKHLERAYAKLGVRDRVSAVIRAGRLGLLESESARIPRQRARRKGIDGA